MDHREKALEQHYTYQGKVVSVRVDRVLLPDGNESMREVVEHPGGVCVAMEDENGLFSVVTQWRYAQEKELTEFPAGKLEWGENPFDAVKREAAEDTGFEGRDWVELGEFVPTGAYGGEKVWLYYAKQGQYVGQHLDSDEHLDTEKLTLEKIIEKIMAGEITDGKTAVLAFKVREWKNRR